MSEPGKDKEDELAGTEAPFVSHLIELRDRLIRAAIAVAIAFGLLCIWPGPGGLYDLLAAPLLSHLPPVLRVSAGDGHRQPALRTTPGGGLLPWPAWQSWGAGTTRFYRNPYRS